MSQKDFLNPAYRQMISRGMAEIGEWRKSPIDYDRALEQMTRTLAVGTQMESSRA